MKGDKEVVAEDGAGSKSQGDTLDGEGDNDDDDDEEEANFAWKASQSTPYLKSVEDEGPPSLGRDSDEGDNSKRPPYRPMKKNMGVSISMLDEKDATSVILDSLGEARRKRVDMESLRLKAEDQFMMIGHAESELENKRGVGKKYEQLAREAEAQGGSPARLSLRMRQEEEKQKEEEERQRIEALKEEEDSDMYDSEEEGGGEENYDDEESLDSVAKQVNMGSVMDGVRRKKSKTNEREQELRRGKTEEEEEDDEDTQCTGETETMSFGIDAKLKMGEGDAPGASRARSSSKKVSRKSTRKSSSRPSSGEPGEMPDVDVVDDVEEIEELPKTVFTATAQGNNPESGSRTGSRPITVESLKRSKSVQEIKEALEEKLKDEGFVRSVKAYRVQTPCDGKMRGEARRRIRA